MQRRQRALRDEPRAEGHEDLAIAHDAQGVETESSGDRCGGHWQCEVGGGPGAGAPAGGIGLDLECDERGAAVEERSPEGKRPEAVNEDFDSREAARSVGKRKLLGWRKLAKVERITVRGEVGDIGQLDQSGGWERGLKYGFELVIGFCARRSRNIVIW
jgi:hypothetical protein